MCKMILGDTSAWEVGQQDELGGHRRVLIGLNEGNWLPVLRIVMVCKWSFNFMQMIFLACSWLCSQTLSSDLLLSTNVQQ